MFLIGAALAVASAFLVLYWWSEGMIDGSEALILAIVYGGLAVGLFSADSIWMFLLAFIPLVAAIAYTFYSFRLGGMRSYFKARCSEYMATIQADPSNRAAREYLAKTLYSMGELDRAVAELEVVVRMGADIEAEYTLNKWQKELHKRDSLNPFCRWCQTENAQRARKCVKCGSDLPYRSPFNHWLAGGRTASSRLYLIVTAGAALLVISLVFLPVQFAFIPVGLVVLALTGWSLVCSARS